MPGPNAEISISPSVGASTPAKSGGRFASELSRRLDLLLCEGQTTKTDLRNTLAAAINRVAIANNPEEHPALHEKVAIGGWNLFDRQRDQFVCQVRVGQILEARIKIGASDIKDFAFPLLQNLYPLAGRPHLYCPQFATQNRLGAVLILPESGLSFGILIGPIRAIDYWLKRSKSENRSTAWRRVLWWIIQ
jgi:hypothetical protein